MEIKPHARMHQVVIIDIVVIVAMLALCYSIYNHTSLILYVTHPCEHCRPLNIMCT